MEDAIVLSWAHVSAVCSAPTEVPRVEEHEPRIIWIELSPAHLESTEYALLSVAVHTVVERCSAPPSGLDSGVRRSCVLLFPSCEDRTGLLWPRAEEGCPLVVALRAHPSEASPAVLHAVHAQGRALHIEAPSDARHRAHWRELVAPGDPEHLLSRPDTAGRVTVQLTVEGARRAAAAVRPASKLDVPPSSVPDALRARSHHLRRLLSWEHAAIPARRGLGGDRDPWVRLCDPVALRMAWSALRAAGTGPAVGADGIRPPAFSLRLEAEIDGLVRDLRDGSYAPLPLRWFTLPKPHGGERRIGISAVRDRLVQRAWLTLAEPWFEPGFSDRSFAVRPRRAAHHAIVHLLAGACRGLRYAVRLDVRSCFDMLPHDLVVARVAERLPSPRMLALLGRWLRAGLVSSTDSLGRGVVQGSILSPFLSKVVLDDLDHALEAAEVEHARHADDIFLLCRTEAQARGSAELVRACLRYRLGLELNDENGAIGPLDSSVCFFGFRLYGPGVVDADPERLNEAAARMLGAIAAVRGVPEAAVDTAIRRIEQQVDGVVACWCHLGITPGLAAQMGDVLGRLQAQRASLPESLADRAAWSAVPDLQTLVSRFGLFTAGSASALGGAAPSGFGPYGEGPERLLDAWVAPPGAVAVETAPKPASVPSAPQPRAKGGDEPTSPIRLDERVLRAG